MIAVPPQFASVLVERRGRAGADWAADLPRLIDDCCRRWGLSIDGAPMTGHLAIVIPVLRGREPCVLRLAALDGSAVHEARALRHWAGHGTVLLLEDDPAAGAMLLERLDGHRTLATLPLVDAMRVSGDLIRILAIPGAEGFPTVAELAARIVTSVPDAWERLGRPMPRRFVDLALHNAASLPTADALMVDWDLWDGNVLAGTRLPWTVIDPRVAVGPPEFGLAQLLWRRVDQMTGPADLDRCVAVVTDAAGLDPRLTRAWTVVRLVDYWLWALGIGLTFDPARCATLLEWMEP